MEPDLNVRYLHYYACAIGNISNKNTDSYWENRLDWYDAMTHVNDWITELYLVVVAAIHEVWHRIRCVPCGNPLGQPGLGHVWCTLWDECYLRLWPYISIIMPVRCEVMLYLYNAQLKL